MKTVQIEATPTQFKQLNDFAEKIGAKIVKLDTKKVVSKKEDRHPNLIETDNYCKYLKNEIIKKYNETAKIKAKPVI